MTDDTKQTLDERVMAFELLELPGQPPMMHMGTAYLVNDLWAEIKRLQTRTERLEKALHEAVEDIQDAMSHGLALSLPEQEKPLRRKMLQAKLRRFQNALAETEDKSDD